MPLVVASGMTKYSSHDAQEFDEGTSTLYIEGMREGTGYVGYDVDIETVYNFNTTVAPPADMTNNHLGCWLRISNASSADIKANGGIQLAIRDSSGNESYWYAGGSDTYAGGWAFFIIYTGNTPDANNGTVATLTDAADLGVGAKMLAKSADDNIHIDAMYYGNSGLVVTGTPDTGTYGIDNAMEELYDLVEVAAYGLLTKLAGVFVGKGPIQFNDDATGTCTFEDAGSTFVWADLPVNSTFFKLSLGSSTGVTTLRMGTVVGTGDGRQGVNGGAMQTVAQPWTIDFATNLSANAGNSVLLYGCNISGATGGVKLEDGNKTTVVSAGFVNCGEIDPGTVNDGAEMLNFAVIDPDGTTNNYGLKFPQTPVTGTLTHNIKQVSLITSGTPTTQYMLHFPYAGDYSVNMDSFTFYGDFSSGTLWHGINTGLNADITYNVITAGNAVTAEFSNTNGGTVDVVSGQVTLTVTAKDQVTSAAIEKASVTVLVDSGGPLPYQASVTISQTGGTATVAHTAHGLVTGNKVYIDGANENNYNRTKTITVTGVDSYTYLIDSGTASPATGTITSTAVIIDGWTNASGVISDTRSYSSNQLLDSTKSKGQRGTSAPTYKPSPITGTIDSANGLAVTLLMISDD